MPRFLDRREAKLITHPSVREGENAEQGRHGGGWRDEKAGKCREFPSDLTSRQTCSFSVESEIDHGSICCDFSVIEQTVNIFTLTSSHTNTHVDL